MLGQPLYYIARLKHHEDLESFLLVPETIARQERLQWASTQLQQGREWIERYPAEVERLALVLRVNAHWSAAMLQEHYDAFQDVGIDTLQECLLLGEVRAYLARRIAPALVASLQAEAALSEGKLRSAWLQALGAKGRYEFLLPALCTLHHRVMAAAVARQLGLTTLNLPPLEEMAMTETAVSLSYFAEGPKYLYVMNNLPYHAVREVLSFGKFERTEDSPWPTAPLKKGTTSGHAQLYPVEMDVNPYRETHEQRTLENQMWEQVSELNDLDADLLDMLSALWVSQARGENDFAHVSVKQLLKMRGLKPKTGEGGRSSGYRPDQRKQLFQSLSHISNLFLLLHEVDLPGQDGGKSGDRREVRSRAFIITDVAGNRTSGGTLEIDEFLIRPGVLFGHFLFGNGRQIALLSAKAIQYDRIREDWEKRLARYLSWQWRNDAIKQRGVRTFLVKTLLENIGKTVDEGHPKRTRQRLEKALNRLAKDLVIQSWRWDREARPSEEEWLGWGVEVEMPDYVRRQYQYIGNPNRPALPLSLPLETEVVDVTPVATATATAAAPAPASEASISPLGMLMDYRLRNDISQQEMAEKLGISQSYYSLLERGSRKPSTSTERAILRFLAEQQRQSDLS